MQESLVIVGFRYFHPVEAISNHRSGTIWGAREGITETVIVIAIVNTSTWRMGIGACCAHACSIAMTYQRINNSIGVKSGASLPAADSMGRLMNLSYLRAALHLHSSASKLRADIYIWWILLYVSFARVHSTSVTSFGLVLCSRLYYAGWRVGKRF